MKFRFSCDITSACGRYESSLNLNDFVGRGTFCEHGSILQVWRIL